MRKIILAAGMLAVGAPAFAHWQWSRWAMSPQQVQAASPTPMRAGDWPALSTPQSHVRLVGYYDAAGGLRFTAVFGFDDQNGLNRVQLSLDDKPRCSELNQLLRSVYGEPLPGRQNDGLVFLARWRDERGGNLINLLAIGGLDSPSDCSVTYQPILSRDRTGL